MPSRLRHDPEFLRKVSKKQQDSENVEKKRLKSQAALGLGFEGKGGGVFGKSGGKFFAGRTESVLPLTDNLPV